MNRHGQRVCSYRRLHPPGMAPPQHAKGSRAVIMAVPTGALKAAARSSTGGCRRASARARGLSRARPVFIGALITHFRAGYWEVAAAVAFLLALAWDDEQERRWKLPLVDE